MGSEMQDSHRSHRHCLGRMSNIYVWLKIASETSEPERLPRHYRKRISRIYIWVTITSETSEPSQLHRHCRNPKLDNSTSPAISLEKKERKHSMTCAKQAHTLLFHISIGW